MKKEKRRSLPLFWRLMATILVCWVVLLSLLMSVTVRYSLRAQQDRIDNVLMSTVTTLANSPNIRRILERGSCDGEMADFLEDVIANTQDMKYITIADAQAIRVYHVDPAYIGKPFEGGDEQRALNGESYLSDAVPEHFEPQRRAFHPVFGDEGEVLGFVMASATMTRITQLRGEIYGTYIRLFVMLAVCSLVFCLLLAMYLGRYLRGVKPEDILRVYLTQNDILNALDEGIVSFDNTGRVRLVNAAAAKMLGHREDLLVGRQVDELIRTEDGTSLRQLERSMSIQSDHPNILVQPVRLPDGNLWARRVLILADKSEVIRYAEELGGTRHMLGTLRANTHEFLNKLQVVSGLLQMGYVEEAKTYIGTLSQSYEHILSPVMKLIRNTSVAALILGKESNMQELDIELTLMSNSCLPQRSRYLSTDELVTVVGNLLENAMEATDAVPLGQPRDITLQLTEDEKGLLIMVSDTGEGISPENLARIYDNGFSTKAATGRGVGMKRVKEIVDRHGGSIDVDTEPGSGTTFAIIFSRERGGYL